MVSMPIVDEEQSVLDVQSAEGIRDFPKRWRIPSMRLKVGFLSRLASWFSRNPSNSQVKFINTSRINGIISEWSP